ncbi:MAG: hypothetical protein JOZ80_01125 [Acidobacteriaceae bacterium]|nr:hypothetical protein [Acidobacteriaceae bacterium]
MKVHLVMAVLINAVILATSLTAEQVRLRDSVEINHKTVLLTDLLPPDTPANIRESGTLVELCRAPQPGSLRTLRQDQILSAMNIHAELLRVLIIPSAVVVRSRGWPISQENVRNAIAEFLGKTEARSLPDTATLILPEFLAAADENYKLQVTHLQSELSGRELDPRVRCVPGTSCGMFLVRVILGPATEVKLRRPATSPNSRSVSTESRLPLVVQGTAATLILEDAATRISLSVLCLESGLLNQHIRVLDKQSRRVYAAEVVGSQLLRANL